MSKKTELKLYGIFGYPLGHTLSPAMQEAAFKHCDLNARYLVLELAPQFLAASFRHMKKLKIQGFNVTVPYKETVMRYLDRITPEARAIGAVNTVYRKGSMFVGGNTDAYGFATSLKRDAGFQASGKQALLLGAGGSARAVAVALASERIRRLRILNRSPARARTLAAHVKRLFPRLSVEGRVLSKSALKEAIEDADLVVNSTSVGLRPRDPSLVAPELIPRSRKNRKILFFDLIYRPQKTRLLTYAEKKGHRILNGSGMLVWQGARAFENWTNRTAPVATMKQAFFRSLAE